MYVREKEKKPECMQVCVCVRETERETERERELGSIRKLPFFLHFCLRTSGQNNYFLCVYFTNVSLKYVVAYVVPLCVGPDL